MHTLAHPERGGAEERRDLNKYLSVALQGETYGVPVLKVREIIEHVAETPLPVMPHFVRGAINLRGRGVPVLDLARRLGRGESQVARRSCIVIVEAAAGNEGFDVGLLVDAVNEVVDIAPDDIEKAPSFGGKLRSDFLLGMGKIKGRFILLFDVDRLVSVEEMTALGEAVI